MRDPFPPSMNAKIPWVGRVANLWTEFSARHVDAMATNGTGCKTLVNPWWLQLLKRQKLTFLPQLRFGTERSEVRILSPRPNASWESSTAAASGGRFSVTFLIFEDLPAEKRCQLR